MAFVESMASSNVTVRKAVDMTGLIETVSNNLRGTDTDRLSLRTASGEEKVTVSSLRKLKWTFRTKKVAKRPLLNRSRCLALSRPRPGVSRIIILMLRKMNESSMPIVAAITILAVCLLESTRSYGTL